MPSVTDKRQPGDEPEPRPNPLAALIGLFGFGGTIPIEVAASTTSRRRSGGPAIRKLNQRQRRIQNRRSGVFSARKRRNK